MATPSLSRQLGAVLIAVAMMPASFAAEPDDSYREHVAYFLGSEDFRLRHRACLALAARKSEPEKVVKAVILAGHGQNLLPVKLLGKAATPFLYPYLSKGEAHPGSALVAIALINPDGPGSDVPWGELDKSAAADEELQLLLELLRAANEPSEAATRRLGKREPISSALLSRSGVLVPAVIFNSTRGWGIRTIRDTIRRELPTHDGLRPDPLDHCLLALGAASPSGALEREDLALMEEMTSTMDKRDPSQGGARAVCSLWLTWTQ